MAFVLMLLAQAVDQASAPGWLSVVIQTGSFGLVAYGVIYGLPWMYRTISDDRQREQLAFSASLKEVTETLDKAVDKLTADMREMRGTFEREQHASRDFTAKETAELRSMLIQNLTAMRVAVHDVRGVAQMAINKSAIAELNQGETKNG